MLLATPSFRPHYETRRAPLADATSARPWPARNHLLAALPPEDYHRLLPKLEPVTLPTGCIVHSAGDWDRHLYFLTAGVVSRLCVTRNGPLAEVALTGNEGVIGVASFLSGERTPGQAVVLSPGRAFRLKSDLLKGEFDRGGALPRLLLSYTLALISQVGQIAVCTRHHPLEQQLCRWILSILDRVPTTELSLTHELISHILGVRRESVTAVAGKLQEAGLIQYARGHLAVLDRPGLERHACECYSVVKREYDRLLPR